MNETTDIYEDDYFMWLLQVVNVDDYHYRNHVKLLEKLYITEFYAVIHRDENRLEDGLDLREMYLDAMNGSVKVTSYTFPPYCSMLEMLVAFARRIEEDIMWDPDYGDRTDEWFWLMLDSLGLSDITDDVFDEKLVENILNDFLERRNNVTLFPVTTPKKASQGGSKVSQIELWYQMNYYFDGLL